MQDDDMTSLSSYGRHMNIQWRLRVHLGGLQPAHLLKPGFCPVDYPELSKMPASDCSCCLEIFPVNNLFMNYSLDSSLVTYEICENSIIA